jgi:hypothetical protein
MRMDALDLLETQNGTTAREWRDRAIDLALAAEAMDGNGVDALLQQIRLHQPGGVSLVLWLDRPRVLEFLKTRTDRSTGLLTGTVLQDLDGRPWPYFDWFAVEREGATMELVLAPGVPGGSTICTAADEAAVWRFGQALTRFAERPMGRCLTYSAGWKNAPDLDARIGAVTWDDVVLPPPLLAAVREAVDGFFRHRGAFQALGFPWRRGILLVGPPGTGKTMILKAAVASVPDLPFLYVRDLRERTFQDAIRLIFQRARRLAPCILAFEDIDGFVTDANRSVFLNELDGFENNEGLLIIGSSNHPGQIDEALLKRPSRFDRVFHIGLPEAAERRAFCRHALSRSALAARLAPDLDLDQLAAQVAERTEGFTPAYLKEALIGAALERAQAGAMGLDQAFAAAVLRQLDELAHHLRRLRNPEALAEFCGQETGLGFRR